MCDLRTNQHFTLKRNPLRREHLQEFVEAFRPAERHKRDDAERFKRFTSDELLARRQRDEDARSVAGIPVTRKRRTGRAAGTIRAIQPTALRSRGSRATRSFELVPTPVSHRTSDRTRVVATLDQLLPDLALLRHPQEEPGDRDDRDD